MASITQLNATTQQPSRFLALPAELRLIIYEHAVTTHTYILDFGEGVSKQPCPIFLVNAPCLRFNRAEKDPLSSAPFLLTNKQIYREALSTVYSAIYFLVACPKSMLKNNCNMDRFRRVLLFGSFVLRLDLGTVDEEDRVRVAKTAAQHLQRVDRSLAIKLLSSNLYACLESSYPNQPIYRKMLLAWFEEAGCPGVGLEWCIYWDAANTGNEVELKQLLGDPKDWPPTYGQQYGTATHGVLSALLHRTAQMPENGCASLP